MKAYPAPRIRAMTLACCLIFETNAFERRDILGVKPGNDSGESGG